MVVDAAQSGAIGNSQSTWMQMTVTGPATLSFYWKVSSEASYDYLRVYLDGVKQYEISGEVNWQQKSINIPSGSHTVKWEYSKDGAVVRGSDKGWVDQIVLIPTAPACGAPSSLAVPSSSMTGGYNVTWGASSTTGVTYVLEEATNTSFTGSTVAYTGTALTKGIIGKSNGTYYYRVKATKSGFTDSGWFTSGTGCVVSIPGGSLSDAVDVAGVTITTGGNANWVPQTAIVYNGGDAAQSGAIGNSQSTWMQMTVTGPVTLSFYWKVSSEASYDYLRVYLDGVKQYEISGEVNWQQKSINIPSGSHTVKWEYSKDGAVVSGSDKGWVDQIVLSRLAFRRGRCSRSDDYDWRKRELGSADRDRIQWWRCGAKRSDRE